MDRRRSARRKRERDEHDGRDRESHRRKLERRCRAERDLRGNPLRGESERACRVREYDPRPQHRGIVIGARPANLMRSRAV